MRRIVTLLVAGCFLVALTARFTSVHAVSPNTYWIDRVNGSDSNPGTGVATSNMVLSGGTLTVTATNTFSNGNVVDLLDITSSSPFYFLNNQAFAISGVTGSSFQITGIAHADVGSATVAAIAARPWQHAPGMFTCSGVCATYGGTLAHVNGDRFVFRGGDTWPNTDLFWNWQWSGTQANVTTIGGLDQSWFNSSTCGTTLPVNITATGWCRPVISASNTACASACTNNGQLYLNNVNWVKVDWMEFADLYASVGNRVKGISNYHGQNNEVSHIFFHHATRYPVFNSTSISVTSNVVTVIAGNNAQVGDTVAITGIVTSPSGTFNFINGQTVTITAATATQFSFNFTHADVASTATSAGEFGWIGGAQGLSAFLETNASSGGTQGSYYHDNIFDCSDCGASYNSNYGDFLYAIYSADIAANNYVRYLAHGLQVNFNDLHGNVVEYPIGQDPSGDHGNAIFVYSPLYGTTKFFYNNVMRHAWAGSTGMFSIADGNSGCPGCSTFKFDNLTYDLCYQSSSSQCISGGIGTGGHPPTSFCGSNDCTSQCGGNLTSGCPASTTSHCDYGDFWVYNNGIDNRISLSAYPYGNNDPNLSQDSTICGGGTGTQYWNHGNVGKRMTVHYANNHNVGGNSQACQSGVATCTDDSPTGNSNLNEASLNSNYYDCATADCSPNFHMQPKNGSAPGVGTNGGRQGTAMSNLVTAINASTCPSVSSGLGSAMTFDSCAAAIAATANDTTFAVSYDSTHKILTAPARTSVAYPTNTDAGPEQLSGTTYSLSVTTANGSVTSSPSGISCGATCSASFGSGTSVTLTAVPNTGYGIASWTGCDSVSTVSSTNDTCLVGMSSNRSVITNYSSLPTCSLNLSPVITFTQLGRSVGLTWTTANATAATIDHSVGSVATGSGTTSVVVSSLGSITYMMTVTGAGGSNTCSAGSFRVDQSVANISW